MNADELAGAISRWELAADEQRSAAAYELALTLGRVWLFHAPLPAHLEEYLLPQEVVRLARISLGQYMGEEVARLTRYEEEVAAAAATLDLEDIQMAPLLARWEIWAVMTALAVDTTEPNDVLNAMIEELDTFLAAHGEIMEGAGNVLHNWRALVRWSPYLAAIGEYPWWLNPTGPLP